MPTSAIHKVPFIVRQAMKWRPKTVLDVGIGFGKYGLLLREYLELWGEGVDRYVAHFERANWRTKIVGIEIFAKLIQPWHQHIYDETHVGDALDLVPALGKAQGKFDMILIADMIEHVTKDRGLKLIELSKAAGKRILITTPDGFHRQNAVFGNEHERHLCGWSAETLRDKGFVVTTIKNSLCATWEG